MITGKSRKSCLLNKGKARKECNVLIPSNKYNEAKIIIKAMIIYINHHTGTVSSENIYSPLTPGHADIRAR